MRSIRRVSGGGAFNRSARFLALGLIGLSLGFCAFVPSAKASWILPSTLLSDTGLPATNPAIAISPEGQTTIVWRAGGDRILASTRQAGSGSGAFSEPVLVADEVLEVDPPSIAVGPDGETTVVWTTDGDGSPTERVRASTRPSGADAEDFSDPFDLTPQNGSYSNPQVAAGPEGEVTAIWSRSGPTAIQATTRSAGSNSFNPPFDLVQGSVESQDFTIGPDGTTTVVWADFGGPDEVIEASTRAAGAGVNAFSAPVDISLSSGSGDAVTPAIATGPDGEATVVWSLITNPGVTSIIYAATREPGAANFFDPIGISGSINGLLADPEVAFGPSGEAYATWTRQPGPSLSRAEVAKRSSLGASFSDPEDVSGTTGIVIDPQLTVDGQGEATVLWRKFADPVYSGMQAASRASTSTAFTDPVNLSAPVSSFGAGQGLASGPCGSFTTAVWASPDDGGGPADTAVYQASDPTPACPKVSFVSITYPKKMKKSKKKVWKVKVKNSGGLKLTGVEVRYNHPRKGNKRTKGTKKVGSLDPGKSKTVSFGVTIRKKGKARVVIAAVSSNGGKKEKTRTVKVK